MRRLNFRSDDCAKRMQQLSLLDCGAGPMVASGGKTELEVNKMKENIHPDYQEIEAKCSCGNVIKTRSTLCKDILLDVCSACHPFYTGKQKVMDTGGRIDKFKKRFGSRMGS